MGAMFRISDIVRSYQPQKQYRVAASGAAVPWPSPRAAKKPMNLAMMGMEITLRDIENSDI
ncbi:MAG TPA: hypothetical protein VGV39_21935 [Mesorhizobium sp.]|jgi:hypothetical protein|uniref:hypothetical protein n=1 Tax=Mesorhizobium sp. TaxID=1871066 RepID=UPI002DDCBD92|nr:hypothetical protein [Mesorhizobium sp.]HEV2505754.1 hypothetical protein [Mesorhizobium sp.]